jgi:hypothetical protein
MKTNKHQHILDRMKGWLFVKDTDKKPHKQYAIAGLGYRSDATLKKVAEMKVGDSIKIYDYRLTRVE